MSLGTGTGTGVIGNGKAQMAYVFERFPSYTQTFCLREVTELERRGLRPLVFSIHDTRDEVVGQDDDGISARVTILPQGEDLVDDVKRRKEKGELPKEAVLTLRYWGDRPDKKRVYEAIFIGENLRAAGLRHVHCHFAGLAARTCWWIRQFYDITFSFTGHANDLFCPEDYEISRQRLMAAASRVVTVSNFTADYLRKGYPRAAGKVWRVYNGLDLAPIRDGKSAVEDEPPLLISVGRLIEKKGFEDLVRACGRLVREGLAFRCEIIGDGERRTRLEALIREHGVEEVVALTGARDQKYVIERLHAARAFVLPCVTEADGGMDNLPTVIMEAMAAGLPCVSTRLAGVPEMVVDGRTGFLVDEGAVDDLAGRMRCLLVDAGMARRMGKEGLARAEALFSKEKTAKQLMRALVSGGMVRWSGDLMRYDRLLLWSYLVQLRLRVLRLFGVGRSRKQRFPGS